MKPAAASAIVAGLVFASVSRAETGAGRDRIALSVSPARLAVAGPSSRIITVRNVGAERVVVDLAPRPVGRRRTAQAWLKIVPAGLVLRSGQRGVFTVRIRPPRRAEPGNHHVLVLLTTRPLRGSRVAVRMRLGVRVRVRVRGPIVRRLELRRIRVHGPRGRRILFVSLLNRGNVTAQPGGQVTLALVRRGRVAARLRSRVRRALLPGAHATLALRYGGGLRGHVTAVVEVRVGVQTVKRRYRIRL